MNTELILVTYNRPHHTQRVLDAIRAEGIEKLSIVLDAPATEKDAALQEELLELYKTIDWADVHIRRREKNSGLAHSIVDSVTRSLATHDAVIILEDDCKPLPGFFEYMNRSLEIHQNNRSVRSICGYQFPFVERAQHGSVHAMALYRFNPWGWATWPDRWAQYTRDLKSLVQDTTTSPHYEKLGADLKRYCQEEYYLNGKADIWSLNWVLLHYIHNDYALFPSRSLIENIGFDGTGVHSVKTHAFDLDAHHSFSRPDIQLLKNPPFEQQAAAQIDDYLDQNSRKVMVKLPKLV